MHRRIRRDTHDDSPRCTRPFAEVHKRIRRDRARLVVVLLARGRHVSIDREERRPREAQVVDRVELAVEPHVQVNHLPRGRHVTRGVSDDGLSAPLDCTPRLFGSFRIRTGIPSSSSHCRKYGIFCHGVGMIRLKMSTGTAETYASAVTTEPSRICEVSPRSRRDRARNAAEITFETRPRSRLQPLDGAVVVCEELLERRVEPHLPATRLQRQAQRPCAPMLCGRGLGTRADGLTECAP